MLHRPLFLGFLSSLPTHSAGRPLAPPAAGRTFPCSPAPIRRPPAIVVRASLEPTEAGESSDSLVAARAGAACLGRLTQCGVPRARCGPPELEPTPWESGGCPPRDSCPGPPCSPSARKRDSSS